MPINYFPAELLERALPDAQLKDLMTREFKVNRTVMRSLHGTGILSEKKLEQVAMKVIKQYNKKYNSLRRKGISATEAFDMATNDKRLLIQRVKQAAVYEVDQEIKRVYKGKKYRWLPSSAKVPDPLHQLKYMKVYVIGKGEMPGDRFGCACGMRILVDEDEIIFHDELGLDL